MRHGSPSYLCDTLGLDPLSTLITDHYMFKIMHVIAYVLEPRSQNIVPNIKAVKIVNMSLTALYSVLRQ